MQEKFANGECVKTIGGTLAKVVFHDLDGSVVIKVNGIDHLLAYAPRNIQRARCSTHLHARRCGNG